MEVLIVRHAIAHERNARRWRDDYRRPLSAVGIRKFIRAALGRFISACLGRGGAHIAIKNGGVAYLRFPGKAREGRATLMWLLTPRARRALG